MAAELKGEKMRDNHDQQMLSNIRRIARALEDIAKALKKPEIDMQSFKEEICDHYCKYIEYTGEACDSCVLDRIGE